MIDWNRVQTLRDEIGADDFDEVVPLFMAEVTSVTDRLADGCNPATLAEDLHFLKGSALNLGFEAFSGLCSDGEVLAQGGQVHQVDVPAILACFEQSRKVFENGLAQGQAA